MYAGCCMPCTCIACWLPPSSHPHMYNGFIFFQSSNFLLTNKQFGYGLASGGIFDRSRGFMSTSSRSYITISLKGLSSSVCTTEHLLTSVKKRVLCSMAGWYCLGNAVIEDSPISRASFSSIFRGQSLSSCKKREIFRRSRDETGRG